MLVGEPEVGDEHCSLRGNPKIKLWPGPECYKGGVRIRMPAGEVFPPASRKSVFCCSVYRICLTCVLAGIIVAKRMIRKRVQICIPHCDDERTQLRILGACVRACSVFGADELMLDTFLSGADLIRSIEAGATYSYIFLTSRCPGSPNWTSTRSELLPEVFALRLYGFLLKPYDQDTFDRAIKSVRAQRPKHNTFSTALTAWKLHYPAMRFTMSERTGTT